jgi:hypothetical protein
MAVTSKTVLWDIIHCSLVEMYKIPGATCLLRLQCRRVSQVSQPVICPLPGVLVVLYYTLYAFLYFIRAQF